MAIIGLLIWWTVLYWIYKENEATQNFQTGIVFTVLALLPLFITQ